MAQTAKRKIPDRTDYPGKQAQLAQIIEEQILSAFHPGCEGPRQVGSAAAASLFEPGRTNGRKFNQIRISLL